MEAMRQKFGLNSKLAIRIAACFMLMALIAACGLLPDKADTGTIQTSAATQAPEAELAEATGTDKAELPPKEDCTEEAIAEQELQPAPTEPDADTIVTAPESQDPEPAASAADSPGFPEPVAEPSPATANVAEPEPAATESVAPRPESPTREEPAATPAPKSAPPAAIMDLDGLETRLRKTKAIGLFTKLELKSQVNELLDDVESYHEAKSSLSLGQLEEHFNLLVMKLLVLLENEDPNLHREIAQARPVLWTTLADPVQFSTLKGP